MVQLQNRVVGTTDH